MAATYVDDLSADLPTTGSDLDLVMASRKDATLTTVHKWVQSGVAPVWPECVGLRSCSVGGCSSGICRRGGCGIAGLLRRCPLSWLCLLGIVRI